MFPTTLEIIEYLKNGNPGDVKSGVHKICMDYDDQFVLLRIDRDVYCEPEKWTDILIDLGLLKGKRYDIAGNMYYIVERLQISFVHNDDVKNVRQAIDRLEVSYTDARRFISVVDERWAIALDTMLKHFGNIWFDWKNINVGYNRNGDVVFFDIVNGVHKEAESI